MSVNRTNDGSSSEAERSEQIIVVSHSTAECTYVDSEEVEGRDAKLLHGEISVGVEFDVYVDSDGVERRVVRNYHLQKEIRNTLERQRMAVLNTYEASRAPRQRVALPPGHLLVLATSFLLTRGAYKRYVEPAILDMRHEYYQAVAVGDVWHARWIAIRGHLLVIPGWLYALVSGKLAALLRQSR